MAPTTAAPSGQPKRSDTLGALFDARSNSLNSLRLIFATVVAVAHASAIGFGSQPRLWHTDLGTLAVDAFFVLSGFLVTRSYLQLGSVRRFVWHRALRILPAFWLVLIVTSFVIAPLLAYLEGRPPSEVLTGPNPAHTYATDNVFLLIREFGVSGLPTGTATPGVVNGALWTLFYEAVCYAVTALLGLTGLLRRRGWIAVGAGLCGVALGVQALGVVPDKGELYLRFMLMFLLGMLGLLYGDRLALTRRHTVLAVLVTVGSLFAFVDYRLVGGVAFAYLCLWAVVRTPLLRRGPRDDLSYGIYVFHWPIQVVLATAGWTALGVGMFTLTSVTVTALVAWCSWRLVERPALRRKSAFRRPPVTPLPPPSAAVE